MMSREEAIELAREHALEDKHWQPPEWVISAIIDAYYKGYEG